MAPLELFCSEARGEKPHYWLKKLQGTMNFDTKEAEKLYRFEMGLAPGTVADKWWKNVVTTAEKASWAELMKVFAKKWPVPVEAEESPEELKTRIKSTILRAEDLGKIVGPPGDEMYAHLRWAADMRPLIDTFNDPSMLLKSDVRATLLLEIWSVLPASGLDSWEKFFTAVETVDSERVQDEIECNARFRRHGIPNIRAETTGFDPERSGAELYAHIQALMVNMPPIDAPLPPWTPPVPQTTYPCAMSNSPQPQRSPTPNVQYRAPQRLAPSQSYEPTTLQRGALPYMPQMQHTPTNWQMQSSANPFVATPTQDNTPATQFVARLLQTPGSPSAGRSNRNSLGGDPICDLVLARRAAANPCTYPASAAGVQQYQADMVAWETCYSGPNAPAPDYVSYPLTPGTMPAGPPHSGLAKCRESGATQIPIKESNVRALVGNTLFPPGARMPGRFQSGVSQIETDEMEGYNALGMYDVHQMLFEEQEEPESGNGEGRA
ncbi:hypothetical protein DFH08DRAFT_968569 [Mycena albidolilacea]|uniref:Gag protein n=1 Tax=Mycena albidolilacea TaxID=1033008 RepID=A0AAD6ZJM5_9AGAR|nr:hypothetical protein DFH08DRAFT_968569 [Mycena albidolilacea]